MMKLILVLLSLVFVVLHRCGVNSRLVLLKTNEILEEFKKEKQEELILNIGYVKPFHSQCLPIGCSLHS